MILSCDVRGSGGVGRKRGGDVHGVDGEDEDDEGVVAREIARVVGDALSSGQRDRAHGNGARRSAGRHAGGSQTYRYGVGRVRRSGQTVDVKELGG